MCRVVRLGGVIVLLGPTWDFPWWYPNSLRTRMSSSLFRMKYAIKRFAAQMMGWWFGRFPFTIVNDPDCFHAPFVHDADAVYIVWTYEVTQVMRQLGCRLIYWEVDDRLLGHRLAVRLLKRLMMLLPPFRYAGSTLLLVFQR